MPYLDSKISEKHKAGCKKPKAKRLYIRDYDKEGGTQAFIPYGITCPSCKVIVLDQKVPKHNLDKKTETILNKELGKGTWNVSKLKFPEVEKQKQKRLTKKDQRFKELEKIVSRFGDLKYCVACHKPTTASYYGLIQEMNPTDARNARRYGGSGIKCYYPDGEQNADVPFKDWPVCCNRCEKKHFEQSYKDGNHGNPITDVGRKIVAEHCIFPYPKAKE